ncbi:MAG: shikimate kinase [Paludibacter sp.]|nr:shikimate kinase [Paludibacter sp.]
MKPIFLIGFSGAGKTTVGKILAKQMDMQFIDLDEFIERQQGEKITEIFSHENGETSFRSLETELIHELCKKQNIVVATGGGTACSTENLGMLNSYGLSFYLKWSERDLIFRLQIDGIEKRPLLAGKTEKELANFVHFLFKKRKIFYQKAHFTVSGKNDEQIAYNIIKIIKKL